MRKVLPSFILLVLYVSFHFIMIDDNDKLKDLHANIKKGESSGSLPKGFVSDDYKAFETNIRDKGVDTFYDTLQKYGNENNIDFGLGEKDLFVDTYNLGWYTKYGRIILINYLVFILFVLVLTVIGKEKRQQLTSKINEMEKYSSNKIIKFAICIIALIIAYLFALNGRYMEVSCADHHNDKVVVDKWTKDIYTVGTRYQKGFSKVEIEEKEE